MFVSGVGIPVMASLNNGLSERLESPFGAVFVLCLLSMIFLGLYLTVYGWPTSFGIGEIPLHYYGAFIPYLLYICGITLIAPKIGLGPAVFLVLLGQLVSATVIDHFGLFGVMQTPVTAKRALGLTLMAVGVFLAKAGPSNTAQ